MEKNGTSITTYTSQDSTLPPLCEILGCLPPGQDADDQLFLLINPKTLKDLLEFSGRLQQDTSCFLAVPTIDSRNLLLREVVFSCL